MLKSYKYRIYPTEFQKVLIHKHIGCCYMVYNLSLEHTLKNHDELPRLRGVMTPEAQSVGFAVGR